MHISRLKGYTTCCNCKEEGVEVIFLLHLAGFYSPVCEECLQILKNIIDNMFLVKK